MFTDIKFARKKKSVLCKLGTQVAVFPDTSVDFSRLWIQLYTFVLFCISFCNVLCDKLSFYKLGEVAVLDLLG